MVKFYPLIIFRGLTDKNLKMAKFRFNQTLHLINSDNFMKDLFNDRNVLDAFEPLREIVQCNNVKYKKINSEVINMEFFDFLEQNDICLKDGYIKKEPDEFVEGVSLGDRLRYSFLFEDSDYFVNVQEDRI